jgi:hypothetical protein
LYRYSVQVLSARHCSSYFRGQFTQLSN